MVSFRLSRLAEGDLASILAISEERWGAEGRRRYAVALAAAMRKVAADPTGPATRDRSNIAPGARSIHARYARSDDPMARVRRPVHVLYYRPIGSGVVEILGVLHERMEPSRHLQVDEAR